ncbi:DUF3488 domain-containing transglutaminase family protein [Wenzhouxiangella sp. XN201]|uniref:transglutaminase TgpA family protein n=1 Tax=Wenzhouxiangella sp. XN201 TaxID=2710755 RepID=UPI0013CD7B3A|nr:DUF3488 and transglutaminase-like domain-containing protein [Wenzhouxiangella sp. XN201]NEZ03499.1 DUF3488 domain-containing transglutaminase family protein [Wenzhouxiangella sp. XN201]
MGDRLPLTAVAWTLGAFLVAAIPHLLAMPQVLAGVVVAACIWRLLASRYDWRAPPGWLRVTLTLVVIALLLVSYGGEWGRRSATGLLCLMLAAKMMELWRIRDLRLVASVSFFLVATQFLFNERLVYLGYLLAGALVAICALYSIQAVESGHRRAPGGSRSILRNGAVMLLAAVPVALVLFVTFPRLAQPLWGLPDEVMDGRTGLSDSMSPGAIANLFADDSPAFRAEFGDRPPPREQLYWRGPVLWRFDGDTWEQAFLPTRVPARPVPPSRDDYRYSVQLEPHERHWLFALDYPVSAPENARISLDFQITSRHPVTTLKRYEVRSNPEFTDMPELSDPLRRLALDLPGDRNPRTRAMARELRARFDDDRELVAYVLRWLSEEPFFYSLETSPLARHGADEFLFDLRTGYCEYYASAFAVMMRFADIPARIVTGYLGGYWQENGGYMLVRNSDAHAWVEVWLDGSGWTRVDPTAAVSPERVESGSQSVSGARDGLFESEWLRDLRNRYDRLQYLWNNWVLGFDSDRQRRLMQWFGLPEVSRTGMALIMIAALALVVSALAWAWLGYRPRAADPVQRAWQRLLVRMARRGLGKRAQESPRDWVERLAPRIDHAGELQALVDDYCRIHYGPGTNRSQQQQFIERSRRFRPRRTEPRGATVV